MRFDEASSNYAEFGPFFTGMVGDLDEVLAQVPGSERREARAPARRSQCWARWWWPSAGCGLGILAKVATTTWAATPSLCATAVSASLAADEAVECAALADEWHLDWTVWRPTARDPRMWRTTRIGARTARPRSWRRSRRWRLPGGQQCPRRQCGDLRDHRPGQEAAARHGARSPWSRPASPRTRCVPPRAGSGCGPGTARCRLLSSRLPTARR